MDPQCVTFRFDVRVYPLEVVQRAAFRLTNFGSFDFSIGADNGINVTLTVKPGLTVVLGDIQARFQNELLDQKLRQTVADETKTERDLILAYAFSKTKLLG
jgi:His-Xaa-Ser system protein HxsD